MKRRVYIGEIVWQIFNSFMWIITFLLLGAGAAGGIIFLILFLTNHLVTK